MIRNLKIYQIFNSKGTPSVMVKIWTDSSSYSASIPSGTSKGRYEARELPMDKVFRNFSRIRPNFIGRDERDWRGTDDLLQRLDGTENFSKLGENLSLAISIACARSAFSNSLWKLHKPRMGVEFPIPLGNVIGGGKHMGGTDWQEFLVIPYAAKSPAEAVETMLNIWVFIGEEMRKKKMLIGKNLENAWMTRLDDIKTLDLLSDIADDWKARLGIDFASSSLWNGKRYVYKKLGKSLTPGQQIDFVEEIARKYRLYYLEDPIYESGFGQFMILNHDLGKDCIIAGDDLYCTNPKRLANGIRKSSTNGIIIKPNQIGTLSLADSVVRIARENGMIIIPSHRSGETEDNWLADLSIAWDAPFIKSGITGSDMTKLNRLIELWEEIPEVRMADLPI
jgi:enolase